MAHDMDHHMDHDSHHGSHHAMSTRATAVSVTLHCLTGCAIGEILGLVIGTAMGLGNLATIALAISLAFLFGYALSTLPLLRAGLGVGATLPVNQYLLARGRGHALTHEFMDAEPVGARRFIPALTTSAVIAAIAAFMLGGLVVSVADGLGAPDTNPHARGATAWATELRG